MHRYIIFSLMMALVAFSLFTSFRALRAGVDVQWLDLSWIAVIALSACASILAPQRRALWYVLMGVSVALMLLSLVLFFSR